MVGERLLLHGLGQVREQRRGGTYRARNFRDRGRRLRHQRRRRRPPEVERRGGGEVVERADSRLGVARRSDEHHQDLRLLRSAGTPRPRRPPVGGRLRIVLRQEPPADLHQLSQGMAEEDARRLLGARHHGQGLAAAGRMEHQALELDVRDLLSVWQQGGFRHGQQFIRPGRAHLQDNSVDERRVERNHQRHLRLGIRGGIPPAEGLSLVARFEVDRFLADRPEWGASCQSD